MNWEIVYERDVEDVISQTVSAIMNGETVMVAEVDEEADRTHELFTVRRAVDVDDCCADPSAYCVDDSFEARELVRRLIGENLDVNSELWAIADYCNKNHVYLEASLWEED